MICPFTSSLASIHNNIVCVCVFKPYNENRKVVVNASICLGQSLKGTLSSNRVYTHFVVILLLLLWLILLLWSGNNDIICTIIIITIIISAVNNNLPPSLMNLNAMRNVLQTGKIRPHQRCAQRNLLIHIKHSSIDFHINLNLDEELFLLLLI